MCWVAPPPPWRRWSPSSTRSLGEGDELGVSPSPSSQDVYIDDSQAGAVPEAVVRAGSRRRGALVRSRVRPCAHGRGVRVLAEESRDDERHLLANVNGVVADALQRAGDE